MSNENTNQPEVSTNNQTNSMNQANSVQPNTVQPNTVQPIKTNEPAYVEPVSTTVASSDIPMPNETEVKPIVTNSNPTVNQPVATQTVQEPIAMNSSANMNQPIEPIAIKPPQEPITTTAPVNAQPTPQIQPMPESKPKKKSKLALIILILLFLVGAGIGAYFFLLKASPKDIFINMIDSAYSNANNVIDYESHKTIEQKLSLNVELDGTMLQEYLFVNDLDINLDLKVNNESNETSCDFTSTYKNKSLLNGNLYINSNKAYLKANELMDYHVYTNIEQDSESLEMKDLNGLLKEIKEAITLSLKDRYFSKTNETVNVNGKDVKLNKYILTLDKANKKEISENFYNSLLNSENFLKIGSKISKISINELKENIKEAKNEEVNDTTILANVYTKGLKNEFVKLTIVSDENSEINITKNDNEYILEIKDGEQTYKGSLKTSKNDDKTETSIVVHLDNDNKLTLNFTNNVKYDQTVTMINIDKSFDINSLTEEQLANIIKKATENSTIIDLMSNLPSENLDNEYEDYENY